jgi:hypothetical protein
MAVWEVPSYKLEQAFVLSRYCSRIENPPDCLKALCNHVIRQPRAYSHNWPLGNLSELIEGRKVQLRDYWYQYGSEYEPMVIQRLERHSDFRYGLQAVYDLLAATYYQELTFDPQLPQDEINELASSIYQFEMLGGYSNVSRVMQFVRGYKRGDKYGELRNRLEHAAEGWRHMLVIDRLPSHAARVRHARADGEKLPYVANKLLGLPRNWRLYRWKGLTVLKQTAKRRCYVLIQKDVERIARTLEGMSNAISYLRLVAPQHDGVDLPLMQACHKMLDLIVSSFAQTTPDSAQIVCRAYDVAYHFFLAQLGGDLSDRASKEQLQKWQDENLDSIVNLWEVLSIVRTLPMKLALEVLKVYKCLPPPDFDPWIGADQTLSYYLEPNPFGDSQLKRSAKHASLEEFLKFQRWNVYLYFYRHHRRGPGQLKVGIQPKDWHRKYPNVGIHELSVDDMDDVDLKGLYRLPERGYDYLDLLKDKVVCPRSMSDRTTEYELNQDMRGNRSYVVDDLRNPATVEAAKFSFGDVHQLIAFKPEAKKPIPRCFFIGQSQQRKYISAVEDHIADLLRSKVGALAGKDEHEKHRLLNELVALEPSEPHKVYVSFDLKKFSPAFPEGIRKAQIKLWTELLDVPDLHVIERMVHGSRLHFRKMGVSFDVESVGWDFEGQFGRMNTWYHIDVMAYAVHVLQKMGLARRAAHFLSLIDDGILALYLKKNWDQEVLNEVLQVIEEIYNMAGLAISWDKTFVSSRLGVFLNEVYFCGMAVSPGMRAALKFTSKRGQNVEGIAQYVEKVRAVAYGAVRAGMNPLSAYLMYCRHAVKALWVFDRKTEFKFDWLLWFCTLPVALGGLGIVSLLAFSSNAAGDQALEFAAVARQYLARGGAGESVLEKLLDGLVERKSASEMILDPLSVRYAGRKLSTTRTKKAARIALSRLTFHPMCVVVGADMIETAAESVISSFRSDVPADIRAIQEIFETTPVVVLDKVAGKVSAPDTLRVILTRYEYLKLIRGIRYELQGVLAAFPTRL